MAKVTKITAGGKKAKSPKQLKNDKPVKVRRATRKGFFSRFINYFVGAWVELKQVRWPDRKATWGLTIAVLFFCAFFVAVILLLDMLFKYLFELLIV